MSSPKRVFPPAYFLTSLVLMVSLYSLLPLVQLVPSPFRYAGTLPIAAGVGMMLWSAKAFRRADTTIKPFEVSTELVTSGLYRATRNPIYLSMVIMQVGAAFLMGSLSPWFVIPVFAGVIQWRFIQVEERMLEEVFGVRYLEYKSRVRRWI